MEDYAIWINNKPLFSEAWNVQEMPGRRGLPARDQGSASAPGVEGVVPTWGTFQPKQFSLKIWVDCIMPDGTEPADCRIQYERNVSEVLAMFSTRGLFEVRQRYPDGTYKMAMCRVMGDAVVELVQEGSDRPLGFVTIVLENPAVWWVKSWTWMRYETPVAPNGFSVGNMRGSHWAAPVSDAVLFFTGPWVNPGVTDGAGAYIQWTGTLGTGEVLRLDAGRRTARRGASFTDPNAGTSVVTAVSHDSNDGSWFTLYPPFTAKTMGSNTTTASKLTVDYRPKFA